MGKNQFLVENREIPKCKKILQGIPEKFDIPPKNIEYINNFNKNFSNFKQISLQGSKKGIPVK